MAETKIASRVNQGAPGAMAELVAQVAMEYQETQDAMAELTLEQALGLELTLG